MIQHQHQETTTVDYFVVAGGGGGAGDSQSAGAGAGGFRVSNDLCVSAPTMSPLANPTGLPVSASTTYPITMEQVDQQVEVVVLKDQIQFFQVLHQQEVEGKWQDKMWLHQVLQDGSGGQEQDKEVKTQIQQVYLVETHHQFLHPQGNNGGAGGTGSSCRAGGGGGGAGAVGTSASSNNGGPGGIGSFIADAFIGPTAPSFGTPGPVSSTRYFAGGGGGGVEGGAGNPAGTNGTGGTGGGGQAGPGPAAPGAGGSATANTGGGGGGSSRQGPGSGLPPGTTGGTGGSGIVMNKIQISIIMSTIKVNKIEKKIRKHTYIRWPRHSCNFSLRCYTNRFW